MSRKACSAPSTVGSPAGLGLVAVQRLHAPPAGDAGPAGEHRLEQAALVLEIVVHQRAVHAHPLGDVAQGHPVQARLGEQVFGGVEDLARGSRPVCSALLRGSRLRLDHFRHQPASPNRRSRRMLPATEATACLRQPPSRSPHAGWLLSILPVAAERHVLDLDHFRQAATSRRTLPAQGADQPGRRPAPRRGSRLDDQHGPLAPSWDRGRPITATCADRRHGGRRSPRSRPG